MAGLAGRMVAIAVLVFASIPAVPAWAQARAAATARCSTSYPPRAGEARKVAPCGNPQFWLNPKPDFGDLPMWKSTSGQTAFRLDIDAAGGVAGCTIIASNVDPAIDARLCKLLTERGRFHPASNAEGKLVASSFTSRVNWWGGESPRVPIESWARTARVEFDGRQLVRCEVQSEGGASGEQIYMCEDPYSGSSALDATREKPRVFIRRIEYLAAGQTLTTKVETPASTPFARTVMAVEISANGKVQSCTMLAEEGEILYPRLCGLELTYLPLPRGTRAPGKLMRIETIWELPVGTR